MIRPVLTEVVLFLAPFALYAIYLVATKNGVLERTSWDPRILVWLTGIGLALMIVSFVILAQFSGAPTDSTYEPAHIEDGKFVPGRTR
jgi:formate hydrogenlyase subunit 4